MTEYFIDSDNGLDANAGTSTGAAWKTFAKFTATAVANDLGTIRGGMTADYDNGADLAFTADGTLPQPIRMEYDYDDQFSDHVDLAAAGPTETATLTVGSKVWTYTDDVSAGVAAGDVLYASGDDNREFAYEVFSVSTVTVTMYLPYKGAQAGSGKTTFNMQSMPKHLAVTDNFQADLDNDHYWMFQGIHWRGTDPNGTFELNSCGPPMYRDCVFQGNGSSDFGIKVTDDWNPAIFVKCRFFDYTGGIDRNLGSGAWVGEARDCLFDGDGTGGSVGLNMSGGMHPRYIDCEFRNHGTGDIAYSNAQPIDTGSFVQLRNVILASTTEVGRHNLALEGRVLIEDYNGEPGDTRQLTNLSTAEATPTIQSDTGTVRSGGGTISLKVTPSTDFADIKGWEHSRQLLFEHAFYATTDSKTYSVYFRPTLTTDWTTNPVATELWIEAEYWGHATNDFRIITKSTGTINMTGSTTWTALTVTAAPAQTGVLYLRGWYSKTPDDTDTFLCDPRPEVA